MFTVLGRRQSFCDGLNRRNFLQVGALAAGGLTLADLLRHEAQASTPSRSHKSVIMIYLPGGPTHLDTYDMKPKAAVEFRGELRPIPTCVPGIEICELMPLQASIMDKLAILRGVSFIDEHSAHHLMTGFPTRVKRPCIGSVVSRLQGAHNELPPYVSMMYDKSSEDPAYVGQAHQPFSTSGTGLDNLGLVAGVNLDRLQDRRQLLGQLDNIRRDIDTSGALAGVDAFSARALDMVTTSKAREAFDTSKEPSTVRARYGEDNASFLKARRLVEAGVRVVTLATGSWDTHSDNFKTMRNQLPRIDRAIHALVTDLHERGMQNDVAIVMLGEFGRSPRVGMNAGRDHWSPAGFALMAGGGFNLGQAIGETNANGERAKGRPYTPSNILATLYRHLGIDPGTALADNNGRPMYLLDDRDPVKELV